MKIEFDIDIEEIKKEVEKELSESWSQDEEKTTKEKINELFKYSLKKRINEMLREEVIKSFKEEKSLFSGLIKEKILKAIENMEEKYTSDGYAHIRNPIFDGNQKNIFGMGLKLQNYIDKNSEKEIIEKTKDKILNVLDSEKEDEIFELFGEFMMMRMNDVLTTLIKK